MKLALVAIAAAVGFGTARVARVAARDARPGDVASEPPYTPSPAAAPVVTLGYREVAADLLFVRMVGYFGSADNEAPAIAALAEAIAALDPRFLRNYTFGGIAMTAARRGVTNDVRLRAIALLDRAAREFPSDARFPKLAGQIYLADLQTDDPAQRRRWDEAGAAKLEAASRKPNASADAGMLAAALQTKLGQNQRAIDGLREMLLTTSDTKARAQIIDKLGQLENADSAEIAAELLEERTKFERAWRHDRPAVPASMYILIGPPLEPGFDLGDLATGGHDLITAEGFERLEPLYDEAPPARGP